jgi:3,4-dihydroxy 2-butanone 4-phosphate synthase/GTP cyclohydrolase II
MMRFPECYRFAKERGYPIITIEELIKFEKSIKLISECNLVTKYSQKPFVFKCYDSGNTDSPHIVLVYGNISDKDVIPLRIHSPCFTGDVLSSQHCDCGEQLDLSFKYVVNIGFGVVIYPQGHEGRGIGLAEKVKAYHLQSQGMGTYEANIHLGHAMDARSYGDIVSILDDLNIKKVDLLTQNPEKISNLGEKVNNLVPIVTESHQHNENYLKDKMIHFKNYEKNAFD